MIKKIALWYANIGKKIFLYIAMVLVVLCTIGSPILGLVFGIKLIARNDKLGYLCIFVGLIGIVIFLVILGFLQGEVILFDRINSTQQLKSMRSTVDNVIKNQQKIADEQAKKTEEKNDANRSKFNNAKQKKAIRNSKIRVGDEVCLLNETRVSVVDPTIIPANTKCIIKNINDGSVILSTSYNGRYFTIEVSLDNVCI